MPVKCFFLVFMCGLGVFALCVPVHAQSSASQSQPVRPKTVQPKISHAVWSGQTEAYYGISQEDFSAMGLPKLTIDEAAKLFTWAYNRQQVATTVAKAEGKEEATKTQVTFSCGLGQFTDVALSKVHIIVESSDGTASEIMSGVRQRLRAISDVEVVYDRKQADLIVNILGYENQLGTNGIGYTASTVVSEPCVGKVGTYEWEFEKLEDHYLLSAGKDTSVMAEKIVTKVDSNDLESVRKIHAQTKSMQIKKN